MNQIVSDEVHQVHNVKSRNNSYSRFRIVFLLIFLIRPAVGAALHFNEQSSNPS